MYNELELTIPSISSELKKSPISDPERRKFLRNYARNKGMIAHLNPFQTFLEILATDYGRNSVDVNTKSVKKPKIGNNRDRNNNSISKAGNRGSLAERTSTKSKISESASAKDSLQNGNKIYISEMVRQKNWMASIDLNNPFLHVLIAISLRKLPNGPSKVINSVDSIIILLGDKNKLKENESRSAKEQGQGQGPSEGNMSTFKQRKDNDKSTGVDHRESTPFRTSEFCFTKNKLLELRDSNLQASDRKLNLMERQPISNWLVRFNILETIQSLHQNWNKTPTVICSIDTQSSGCPIETEGTERMENINKYAQIDRNPILSSLCGHPDSISNGYFLTGVKQVEEPMQLSTTKLHTLNSPKGSLIGSKIYYDSDIERVDDIKTLVTDSYVRFVVVSSKEKRGGSTFEKSILIIQENNHSYTLYQKTYNQRHYKDWVLVSKLVEPKHENSITNNQQKHQRFDEFD
ncbi:hypothetical protein BB560_000790 [Smittium megazygosporum]|uniref:Uncharacterized protein n=1 Tax=Smittium megazygosporum TaxID=133381 RepID=A0A2T9ZJG7_9FUNG|nr:hypothetical protein BB560_000790 [Smittium megazygosporum]